MAVTIGSVTEGNANAEEIKNNSPDSELYENNKKYLQGSLVKFNDKIYLAKRNVPSDVDLDNPYYWEIFMDAADSNRVDELFEKTGNLDELETESKDNLVAAINEVGSIQPDWNQNDETKKDYIKNRPGGYYKEITEPTLIIYATKQDGINKLINVEVIEDNFRYGYEDSINVGIECSPSEIIQRTLTKRWIPEYVIGADSKEIYGNAHLIDASRPDTGEDIAIYKERSGPASSLYGVGWHVWAPSLPSGDLGLVILEETMHAVPFASKFIPWEASPTATSVLYTAQSLTDEQKVQARANIGAGTPYTLPQATANTLGGVKADSAEAVDTQPVRIGGDGKLYTAAGGTDISLGLTSAAVGQIIKVKAIDESGKPTAWEAANMPSGGGGASYRSWSKVWTLAVAEDIAGFEADNIDLDGKSEIMIVFISDSTASRTMANGRLYINGVDAGKVLFNSLPLRKDSHSFVIIGRADEGIEYTTMQATAEYQTYPWQGEVKIVHRMVSGVNKAIQWISGSTIKITQGSATLGQGVTIEIYVR